MSGVGGVVILQLSIITGQKQTLSIFTLAIGCCLSIDCSCVLNKGIWHSMPFAVQTLKPTAAAM